ncbi:hypothetical protein OH492_07880 [Vibrio chagasii]|nr:hypothetical protein [Vibrio chagasii]
MTAAFVTSAPCRVRICEKRLDPPGIRKQYGDQGAVSVVSDEVAVPTVDGDSAKMSARRGDDQLGLFHALEYKLER